jgi:hypothetical protein
MSTLGWLAQIAFIIAWVGFMVWLMRRAWRGLNKQRVLTLLGIWALLVSLGVLAWTLTR